MNFPLKKCGNFQLPTNCEDLKMRIDSNRSEWIGEKSSDRRPIYLHINKGWFLKMETHVGERKRGYYMVSCLHWTTGPDCPRLWLPRWKVSVAEHHAHWEIIVLGRCGIRLEFTDRRSWSGARDLMRSRPDWRWTGPCLREFEDESRSKLLYRERGLTPDIVTPTTQRVIVNVCHNKYVCMYVRLNIHILQILESHTGINPPGYIYGSSTSLMRSTRPGPANNRNWQVELLFTSAILASPSHEHSKFQD